MKTFKEKFHHYVKCLRIHRSAVKTKHIYEVIGAVLGVVIMICISSVITPYSRYQNTYTIDSKAGSADSRYRASIIEISSDTARIKLLDGPLKGRTVEANTYAINSYKDVYPGATVLVSESVESQQYSVIDHYRLPSLILVCTVFVLCVLAVGRRRGVTSLIGLGLSIIVIVWYLIPQIQSGGNPLLLSLASSFFIAFSSIIIAHGWKLRTLIAVGCVVVLLGLVVIGDVASIHFLSLSGVDDELTNDLAVGYMHIDTRGLLAGGLIIASLGALDDIVTSQVAAIDELKKANMNLGIKELYSRSLSIGSEHIASLVNTLALLYTGASLPILITLIGNGLDIASSLNGELLTTAIIQATLPGIALVLAVPFSSIMAAYLLNRIYNSRQRQGIGTE